MKYLSTCLVPAGGPALDEGPDGDAIAVPVARQVRPQERHVVDLATLVDTEGGREGRVHSTASLLTRHTGLNTTRHILYTLVF